MSARQDTPVDPAVERPVFPGQRLSVGATSATQGGANDVAAMPPQHRRRPTGLSRVVQRLPLVLVTADLLAISLVYLLLHRSILVALTTSVVAVMAFQAARLYRSRITLAISDDLIWLVIGVGAASLAAVLVTAGTGRHRQIDDVLAYAGALLVAVVVLRRLTYDLIRWARRRGLATHRTLIVGTDATAQRLSDILRRHPEHGLRPVGFVGSPDHAAQEVRDALRSRDGVAVAEVAGANDVSVVILTLGGVRDSEVLRSLRMWGPVGGPTIYLVPPLYQMLHTASTDRARDIAMILLRPALSSTISWRIKRLIDVVFASAALLALAPVLALTALAVRLESGPGVLFRQTRVGREGTPFTLYKFRSYRPSTDQESAERWSVAGEQAIGPVGRFIRKTSLDELPQLINVVRGEMSLVGPRPERPHFVESFGRQYDSYALRHRVRPGLTGWAAVSGLRGDTSIEDRAHFDNVYIDNWSLRFDLKILAGTVLQVLRGTGG